MTSFLVWLTMGIDLMGLRGMSCLVLGGGGFIGTHLCRELRRHGARVHGFGRSRTSPEALAGIPWTNGEFTDRAALARAVEGSEVVFHLLGSSTPDSSNKDPLGDLLSATVPTLQLLELCRGSSVRKVVFVSSGGTVYGIPSLLPIPESAPTDPISAYGIGKLAVEKYLALYHHLHGNDFCVLRVANPFGPYQNPDRRQGLIAAFMHRLARDQPIEIWGDGKVVRDFIYIDDVIKALLAAVGYDGPHRVFNVGAGVGRSVLDVVQDIGRVLGRSQVVPVHKPGRAADVPVNILDIALIGREFGWAPQADWMQGLRETAEWMQGT
jgi:UDP-glucose 4-epimerase